MNNVTNRTLEQTEQRRWFELVSVAGHLDDYLKLANDAEGGQFLGAVIASALTLASPEFLRTFGRELYVTLDFSKPAQSGKSQIEPTTGADHVPRPE